MTFMLNLLGLNKQTRKRSASIVRAQA